MSDDVLIVDFATSKPKMRVRGGCKHRAYVVDEFALKVFCAACDVEISPVRVVVDLAKRWDVYYRSAKHAKDEALRLRSEIDDLKRKRRNLRAQVKRLSSKDVVT